jgi:hypothetical protein
MGVTRQEAQTAPCPVCRAGVRVLGRVLIGEVLSCGVCGSPLEIAEPAPLVLEPLARVDDLEEVRD